MSDQLNELNEHTYPQEQESVIEQQQAQPLSLIHI